MDLLRAVQKYITDHDLITPGSRVVVGVSGGPDSVTLLHILKQLSASLGIDLHIAHLNHSIRGADADADEAFVVDLAKVWNLPYTTRRENVPVTAQREKLAIEEAARRERYLFLYEVAEKIGSNTIAVGHNADDQAETVLMHLLRGAGPGGLRGMLPLTSLQKCRMLPFDSKSGIGISLIRPLLGTARAEIQTYISNHELATRFDRSNLDTTIFRNRLRHEVIPYLEQINPRISARLQNLAEVIRADYELVRENVRVAWDTLKVAAYSDAYTFDLIRWREQPLAVRRALVRHAATKLCDTLRDVGFTHVEQAVEIAQKGNTGARAVLPHGLSLLVEHETLTISTGQSVHLPPERPWLKPGTTLEVQIPGVTQLPYGWTLHAQFAQHWCLEAITDNPNPLVAWIDRDILEGSVVLRTRHRGERFKPLGMRDSTV
ncbi:MAG: tRNA lysidine(34) synthetase TilS, partial [Anaerolineae bacterium]|nr:tRNA lysidine(34) synthetase TilS [Anaerolineae bacterium]